MFVTTSKNSDEETKKKALNFSVDKKAPYVNRGKKTIEDLVSLARKEGHSKIAIFRDNDEIDYISIHHGKNWEWSK